MFIKQLLKAASAWKTNHPLCFKIRSSI